MQVIGIAGRSGSGKSTVSLMLADALLERGEMVTLDTFAQPIREYMAEYNPHVDASLRRALMQDIGKNQRKSDPDCFVKELAIRNCLPNSRPGFLIIPDVRYPNEAEFCARHGVLWLVEGNHEPLAGKAAAHESESHIDSLGEHASCTLFSRGSLDELDDYVRLLVRSGAYVKPD